MGVLDGVMVFEAVPVLVRVFEGVIGCEAVPV